MSHHFEHADQRITKIHKIILWVRPYLPSSLYRYSEIDILTTLTFLPNISSQPISIMLIYVLIETTNMDIGLHIL